MAMMPKEMEELLFQIDDPDKIIEIQQKWNEYVAANDNYERVYPLQLAAIVDGNNKFKEQKTLQTPAEQLQMYATMTTGEIKDYLQEKEQGKEEVYEVGDDKEPGDAGPSKQDKFRDFQLTFDMLETEPGRDVPPEQDKEGFDIDKSQDLKIEWLEEYKGQEKDTPDPAEKLPQQDKPYELNISFGLLDELDKSDYEIEPDEPGFEPEEDW